MIHERRDYVAGLRQTSLVSYLYPTAYIFPSSISIGSLNLVGAAIFICGVIAIRHFFHRFRHGDFVFVVSDFCVAGMCGWMLISLWLHSGIAGMYGAGAFAALQFFLVYLTCRLFFSSPEKFLIFCKRMIFVLIISLVYALIDIITSQNFIFRLGLSFSSGFGQQPLAFEAYRFGLVRAQGSLEHPILLGVFFVISAILLTHSALKLTSKMVVLLVCVVGTAVALSSAPILSAVQASAILVYFRMFSQFPWAKLILYIVLLYLLVSITTLFNNPIEMLIESFTLDPQTGFYRMDIWRWVFVNVRNSPWIGIGFADWVRGPNMSATIDSVWLVQTIRYGLPASALLLACCLTTGLTVWTNKRGELKDPMARNMSLCLGVVIFLLCFNGVSVHFWGTIWYYFAAVLGMRAGLTEHNVLSRAPIETDTSRDRQRFRMRRRMMKTGGTASSLS